MTLETSSSTGRKSDQSALPPAPTLQSEAPQKGGKKLPLSDISSLQSLMIATMIAVGLAMITLIIQYFTATQTTYQNLVNQVTAQNAKMDLIILQNQGKSR